MVTRVLPDANVLFSRTLRDWLFLLREQTGGGMFTLAYTEETLGETIYRLRRTYKNLEGAALTRVHDLIVENMDDRIGDYGAGLDSPLGDEFDGHVHAAASTSGVDVVLTDDRGFLELPEDVTDALAYEICSPDVFLLLADDSSPSDVAAVVRRQTEHFRRIGKAVDLVSRLRNAGCERFALRVSDHVLRL